MIPQEPGTAAQGCAQSAASFHSLFSITLLFSQPTLHALHRPAHCSHWGYPRRAGHGIWSNLAKKKRKTLGCEESPASKALGPAPSVPLELPSKGKEATREGSMEEKLKFPVGGSWALLPEQLQQGEPVEPLHRALHTVHMASAGSSGSRTQRTEGKGMCMKHKTSGNIGKNWFPLLFFSYFSSPSYIFFPLHSSPKHTQMFQALTPLALTPMRDLELSHYKYASEQKCIKGLKHSVGTCKIWALGSDFFSLSSHTPSL